MVPSHVREGHGGPLAWKEEKKTSPVRKIGPREVGTVAAGRACFLRPNAVGTFCSVDGWIWQVKGCRWSWGERFQKVVLGGHRKVEE